VVLVETCSTSSLNASPRAVSTSQGNFVCGISYGPSLRLDDLLDRPLEKKALSGSSSCLPEMISSKPRNGVLDLHVHARRAGELLGSGRRERKRSIFRAR